MFVFFIHCSCVFGRATFQAQPPPTLRKSNFFNFILCFHDLNNQIVEIKRSEFIQFVEQTPVKKKNNLITNFLHIQPVVFLGGSSNKKWSSIPTTLPVQWR